MSGGLVLAGDGAKPDLQTIPPINRDDGEGQVDKLFFAEALARLFIDFIRCVPFADERDGFRPGKSGALAIRKERSFLPCVQRIEALSLSPFARASLLCMSMQ